MKEGVGPEGSHGEEKIISQNPSNFFNAMNIDQADALAQMQSSLLQNSQGARGPVGMSSTGLLGSSNKV